MAQAIKNTAVNSRSLQLASPSRATSLFRNGALVVSATVFMAICAHVSVPLVFGPVPLTLQNFGVLLIAMVLGSRRGSIALALYLLEGVAGLPVFNPAGPGGIAQLFGPTGGFLLAYPAAAFIAGTIFERRGKGLGAALQASVIAEIVMFASGLSWLKAVTGVTFSHAFTMAVLPFIPGEVLKIAAASAIASRWNRFRAGK